jgi:hypothetical protein
LNKEVKGKSKKRGHQKSGKNKVKSPRQKFSPDKPESLEFIQEKKTDKQRN